MTDKLNNKIDFTRPDDKPYDGKQLKDYTFDEPGQTQKCGNGILEQKGIDFPYDPNKGWQMNIEIPKIENGLWNDEAVAEAVLWINYRYVVATDGSWKKRGGGWDKKNAASPNRYTTKQLIKKFKEYKNT